MDSFVRAIDPPEPRAEAQRLRRVVRLLGRLLGGQRVEVDAPADSPARPYQGVQGRVTGLLTDTIAETGVLVKVQPASGCPLVAEPQELAAVDRADLVDELADALSDLVSCAEQVAKHEVTDDTAAMFWRGNIKKARRALKRVEGRDHG